MERTVGLRYYIWEFPSMYELETVPSTISIAVSEVNHLKCWQIVNYTITYSASTNPAAGVNSDGCTDRLIRTNCSSVRRQIVDFFENYEEMDLTFNNGTYFWIYISILSRSHSQSSHINRDLGELKFTALRSTANTCIIGQSVLLNLVQPACRLSTDCIVISVCN